MSNSSRNPNMATKVVRQGPKGNSAYTDAVLNGYVGTLQQWLVSLKGQPGVSIKGDKGDRGDSEIYIGIQPPENPQLNDLWIDIS